MKKIIDWRIFWILLVACLVSSVLVLPYIFALNPQLSGLFTKELIIAQAVQTLVVFSAAIFFGLILAKRVGFGLPILEAYVQKKDYRKKLLTILPQSVRSGILAATLIIGLSFLLGESSFSLFLREAAIPHWKLLLVAFYGGIAEEVMMRLFLLTLFVWITFKIKSSREGKPTKTGIWISIVVSTIIFGLGHLPITSGLVAITPVIIFRAILLNGVGGIIFSRLYMKNGLESAMISHFAADIGLHLIFPLIASLLI